jgi:hypothetical protein
MDISKAIDKEAGATREVVGLGKYAGKASNAGTQYDGYSGDDVRLETAPATPEAKKWSGYGTALKPANEPICLARKPLSEKTVAKNVLKHGTGGLNVDASRIAGDLEQRVRNNGGGRKDTNVGEFGVNAAVFAAEANTLGRFPANILFDEYAAAVLDEQTTELEPRTSTSGRPRNVKKGESRFFATFKQDEQCNANTVKLNSNQLSELDAFVAKLVAISERPDTSRSAILKAFTQETQNALKNACATSITPILNTVQRFSREFWLTGASSNSPANSAEALMLTDTMRIIQDLLMSNSFAEVATSSTTLSEMAPGELDLASKFIYVAKASKKDRGEGNIHPTVKPIKLMEYLIKLVTPEGGIVLDPFMGSGTTGVAAQNLGFGFRGIEMTPEYFEICKARILGAAKDAV